MNSINGHVIVVVGPTAVGKTVTAIELANYLNTEIISADSRQFFQEMEIGTAKPSPEELSRAKHHFVNNKSIHEDYNAGAFEQDALQMIDQLIVSNGCAIMVGGSGLYINAVCFGMDDMPEVPEELRERLTNEMSSLGLEVMVERLKKLDPEYHDQVDRKNPQRIIRALEVIEFSGKKYSKLRSENQQKSPRPFDIIWLGLEMPRDILYQRIDERMDQMIAAGLFEEAEELFPYRERNALQTVGYSEIFRYMEGEYDREEAIRLLKRNSRRYAKRQFTWFKRNEKIRWFRPDQINEIFQYVDDQLSV